MYCDHCGEYTESDELVDFAIDINSALPESMQMDTDSMERDYWGLIAHITNFKHKEVFGKYQLTLWELRDEIKSAHYDSILAEVRNEIVQAETAKLSDERWQISIERRQLEFATRELEIQIEAFEQSKARFYEEERLRIIEQLKRGEDI